MTLEEVIETEEEDEAIADLFVPSNEWQPIRKGQVIPAGLHIRLNLETGLKEAKILDQSKEQIDKNVKYINKHKKVAEIKSSDDSEADSVGHKLKEMVKNMKLNEKSVESVDHLNGSERSYRSIDDIKKEFKQMNIKMRSESEVLKILISKYNTSSLDEKFVLLSDIEYLVHSIDIGQDLVKLNGIQLLLSDLNSTDSRLRAQIAFTIGSAMTGNPRVQIEVLKSGGLKEFLLLLDSDPSFDVKKKCLFAISSLVRQFPSAQKSLVKEYGALSIFAQIFKQNDIYSNKLSQKVITLLNDLFIERQTTLDFSSNDENSVIKLKQYHEIDLKEAIVSNGFCHLIPNLLNSGDYEIVEKTIEAMNSFLNFCENDFIENVSLLKKVSDNFEILSKSEAKDNSNDNYFTNLFKLSTNLLNKLNYNSKKEL